jgi:hypothetical protein
MRNPLRIAAAVLLAAMAWTLLAAGPARADTPGVGLDADTMKAALHTNTAQENGFIDRALALVNQHKLPAEMVQSTFLWARRKTRNQFQYFKYALTLRAGDYGVQL